MWANLYERAIYIHKCRMLLFQDLGAVLTVYFDSVRYWRLGQHLSIVGSQNSPRLLGYFAGFCSRRRGLHWDRKRY